MQRRVEVATAAAVTSSTQMRMYVQNVCRSETGETRVNKIPLRRWSRTLWFERIRQTVLKRQRGGHREAPTPSKSCVPQQSWSRREMTWLTGGVQRGGKRAEA